MLGGWGGNLGLAEYGGSLPPGFMASVTCGLTAEDWDATTGIVF